MRTLSLCGVILHLLFLFSIFYIYFQTIIVKGISPQNDLIDPPAKRLVLFVADGLRAESFFKYDCNRTQYLKNILLSGGMIGTSHTRVPTESRPGHVALIAGIYEDPSAVFKGWQENPVDFDSVFNRSRKTFSWGSPDILPMFEKGAATSRVQTYSYNPNDEDFSGKTSTTALDTWVFDRVKTFLNDPDNISYLKNNDRVILFLHLLGLDTAGHIHKPHSDLYTENLLVVDKGISEIVALLENHMENDKKTAYVFTADHGMTDRGSHGSGETYETETPFLVWGAGIKKWPHTTSTRNIKMGDINIPSHDIKQADAASLMSTLIGVSVPVNNFGKLPKTYLDVTEKYLSDAVANNAYQLLAQFRKLCEIAKEQYFDFKFKSSDIEVNLNLFEKEMNFSIQNQHYQNAINVADKIMDLSIKGIEYFQTYYKYELLCTISLTMLGWLLILSEKVTTSINVRKFDYGKNKVQLFIIFVIMLTIIAYNILQNTPFVVILYFISPFFTWIPVYIKRRKILKLWYQLQRVNLKYIIIFAIAIELLVLSFFYRQILCLILLLHSFYLWSHIKQVVNYEKANIQASWLISSILLSIFPALPVVEKDSRNITLLLIGTLLWILKSYDFIVAKKSLKYQKYQAIALTITGIHFIYVILSLNNNKGLTEFNQLVSWGLLVIGICSPVLSPVVIKDRIIAIINSLIIPYSLLSLSYEALFFFSFSSNLFYWLHAENILLNRQSKAMSTLTFDKSIRIVQREVNLHDVRKIIVFMMYLLISFFGTGNVASVSSFDPNWVRCFVSSFSPILMTSLIIFKLIIPILLLVCILKAMHIITEISTQKLFILILIICDIMCLNFLFLVRNEGSWLDIGSSISHFIIMHVTVLVLFILYVLANILTTLDFSNLLRFSNKFNED